MALVKRGPLELVVEKATELGARRIRLVTTRRTNADHTNVSRLEAIAIEAAEQCERLDAPPVDAPVKLSQLLADWPPDRRLLVCDEASARTDSSTESRLDGATSALDALRGSGPAGWSLLVGPEGGLDPDERAVLLAHPAVTPITLGPRILRAETAAIAVLTLWQAALGDWRRA